MPRLHAVVRGHVQGVFFRASLVERARALGLVGWVRNRGDGSLEWVAEGPAEVLAALRAYSARGPRGAHVTAVEISEHDETGEFHAFSMRPDA